MAMPNTETPSTEHRDLDLYPVPELVGALVDGQFEAVQAVRDAAPAIAAAVEAAWPRIKAGGRLIYVGAGTSGRLGVLDSVELYPTFSWPQERALAVLAGGVGAMFVAIEGAEDDREQGASDVRALHPGADDVVMLLAASGATPYVLGALHAARDTGALTIGIANNAGRAAGAGIGLRHHAGHRRRGHLRQHAAEGGHVAEDRAEHDFQRADGQAQQGLRQPDGRHEGRPTPSCCCAPCA